MGSLHSNSLSYLNFRCGFYIAGFDLSTAQDGGLDLYSVPATMKGILSNCMQKIVVENIKFSFFALCHSSYKHNEECVLVDNNFPDFIFLGNLRARIRFNRPPDKDFTLIMFAESTCLLEIPKAGRS